MYRIRHAASTLNVDRLKYLEAKLQPLVTSPNLLLLELRNLFDPTVTAKTILEVDPLNTRGAPCLFF